MDVREKFPSEKRLIDAKVFAEHLERMARTAYQNLFQGLFEAAEYAKDFPTVDAVTVVRCAQCKHFKRNLENDTYCSSVNGLTDPQEDDFCSYGERKEGAD